MQRTTETQAILAAFFAVAAMGGKFYTSNKAVREHVVATGSAKLKKALIHDLHTACEQSAFCIDRPFYGNHRHGWRLSRFCSGSGQADVGSMFLTAGAFYDAMRTTESIHMTVKGYK